MSTVRDLRTFLDLLDHAGQLVRVKAEVDPCYELSAICRKVADQEGPALCFEHLRGASLPVVVNLFGTYERVALALGCPREAMNRTIAERITHPVDPVRVREAPVQAVVVDGSRADVTTLPIPTWNHKDGGPYITAGISVTRDPESGVLNAAIYRLQVKGPQRLGMLAPPQKHLGLHLKKAKERGMPALPVAIAIGMDPFTCLAAVSRIPFGQNELAYAGALMGEPIPLVPCRSVDAVAPALAEIVLEGEIPTDLRETEGPFGETTGYYGAAGRNLVVEVRAITHREFPSYHALYLGTPVTEGQMIVTVANSGAVFQKLCHTIPHVRVVGVNLQPSGTGSINATVSITKQHASDPRSVMLAIWTTHWSIKNVVVVDEDIDVYNMAQVDWALATRLQPERGVVVMGGLLGHPLDPSAPAPGTTSKLGIDATIPGGVNFPERAEPPAEALRLVEERWREYGIPAPSRP